MQIDVFPTYADHPIDRLFRASVALNINTDTHAVTNVTLSEEYERVERTFGWGRAEFLATNRLAVRATFAPPSLKETLTAQLEAAYGNGRADG